MSICKDDEAHRYHNKLNNELQEILTSDTRCAVELSDWLTQNADHMAMGIITLVDAIETISRRDGPRMEIVNLEEALGIKPDHKN